MKGEKHFLVIDCLGLKTVKSWAETKSMTEEMSFGLQVSTGHH